MTDMTAPVASPPKFYKTKEIAEMFSVTPETVRNWLTTGRLKGTQIQGHQYRVRREDLVEFAKSHYSIDL